MNLELTTEQQMLVDALTRALAGADAERLRSVWGTDYLREEYRRIAEMGMLDLTVAACDPDEPRLLEAAILGEALGRHAAITPLVTSVALSATLAAAGHADPTLATALAGGVLWSFASSEPGHRRFLVPPNTSLVDDGTHLRLSGEKRHVDFATQAEGFVVNCQGPRGAAIVAIDATAPGVVIEPGSILGGVPSGRVRFEDAEPRAVLVEGDAVGPALDHAWATTLLLQAGYLVGAAQRLLELTCAHVLERRQFGVPIGTFQSVQHHLADCKIAIDSAHLMVLHTAWLGLHPNRLALSAETKAWAAETAADAARWAHELHGGVSVVDEHEVSLLSRRITAESSSYGSPRQLWGIAGSAMASSLEGVPT